MKEWFSFESVQNGSNKKYMFCFHHAGGSATVYRKWTLESWPITIVAVELPGKGMRIKEKFIEDFDVLTAQIAEAIFQKIEGQEFYLFGHSMGAALAFKTACQLQKLYNKQPLKLIVAGREAPGVANSGQFKSWMSDELLIQELIKVNATPKEILENKDMMNFLLPNIRNDYKLHESFVYCGEKLKIPIIAHAGKSDIRANAKVMSKWGEMTDGDFKVKEFEGNHFFLHDSQNEYIKQLIQDILSPIN